MDKLMKHIISIILVCYIKKSVQLPSCQFEGDIGVYSCEDIVETFPKIYYGNYKLQCRDCEIKVFSSSTFPHENSLLSMNVSNSGIQLVASQAFQNLKNIRYLYLDKNKITNISINAFEGLRQVDHVEIDHNLIVELMPGFLNDIQLNTISLAYNEISELPAYAFRGALALLNLNLQHNRIKKIHYDAFDGLDALENLELQHNSLCHIPIGSFKELKSLMFLNLANNKLTKFAMGTFSGLTDLNTLILANNSIQIFEGTELLPILHLVNLDLSGNSLYYLESNVIYSSAPTMRYLNIEDNLLSCPLLTNIIQYFKSKKVDFEITKGTFDVQNINGIVCVEHAVLEAIPKEVFLKFAREQTNTNVIYCRG